MFNPGETVIHRFTIPFVKEEISEIIVTYKHKDDIFFIKSITSGFQDAETSGQSEHTPKDTTFDVELSQTESLMFKQYSGYKIQLNVYTIFGSRLASQEIDSRTGAQHYREVMSDG